VSRETYAHVDKLSNETNTKATKDRLAKSGLKLRSDGFCDTAAGLMLYTKGIRNYREWTTFDVRLAQSGSPWQICGVIQHAYPWWERSGRPLSVQHKEAAIDKATWPRLTDVDSGWPKAHSA